MVYLLIGAIVIALDQFTKYLIRSLPLDYVYNVIGNFLRIVHVENSGAAFGMFSGDRKFLLILPAIVIIVAVFIIVREKGHGARDVLEKVSLTLIASGGAGNIIDRLLFGQVTDMISFSIFPPVFNVADIAVTCGCGLFVLSLLVDERKEGSK